MLRGFVSPELMSFTVSGNAVVSVLLGGVGTLVGALYGSVMFVIIKSIIGSWTEHHLIAVGALFMCSVLFLPRGLIGIIQPWLLRAPTRSTESEPVARVVAVSQEVKP